MAILPTCKAENRVGKIAGGSIELNKGETLILDAHEGEGTPSGGLDYRWYSAGIRFHYSTFDTIPAVSLQFSSRLK